MKGPKRIQFYMVRTVSARDLSNALLDRIPRDAPVSCSSAFCAHLAGRRQIFMFPRLEGRLDPLPILFGEFGKGEPSLATADLLESRFELVGPRLPAIGDQSLGRAIPRDPDTHPPGADPEGAHEPFPVFLPPHDPAAGAESH